MRLHLTLGLITLLALIITLKANHKHRFGFEQVAELAAKRATIKVDATYVPLPNVLPPQLKDLTPEQEAGINSKIKSRLWQKKALPFQVDFYHISRAFPYGPQINTVDRKGPHQLGYLPSLFNFPNLTITPPLPNNLPFAGFYVRYPLPTADEEKPDVLNGFFTTQGASYFRALARDQVYGLSGRGLAINTVDDKKEEFPYFTDWWLKEPGPAATELTLFALLDSPSVTGAYEFKVRPGGVTTVQIHARLFFRQNVAQLGLAPFSSMYRYGENAKNHFGDNVHPEVHDSDGMVLQTSRGEWIWRPFEQATQRQIYNFSDENPKGFGLAQRDRDFQHFQDLALTYNVRPSVWVTPSAGWGKGVVQIIQAPTDNKDQDNVVVQWHPDREFKAGETYDFSYTIDWYMNDAERPPLAYTKATLVNDPAPAAPPPPSAASPSPVSIPAKGSKPPSQPAPSPKPPVPVGPPPVPMPTGTTPVEFLVDFVGDGIENVAPNTPPDLELVCSPPGTGVRETKVEKNGYGNSWRATFTIVPFKHNVPTELRLRLFPQGGKPTPFPVTVTPPETPPPANPPTPPASPTKGGKSKPDPKPDPKIEAARLASVAQMLGRVKARDLKTDEWVKFLAGLAQAEVYQDMGPPDLYGTTSWTYKNAVAADSPNGNKADLEIFFHQGRAIAAIVPPHRNPLTETWTYTWHQ